MSERSEKNKVDLKRLIRAEIYDMIREPDVKIKGEEDSGFPKLPIAKNIIQWVTQAQFLNMPSLWEFPTQFEILRDFYELLCPNCNPPEFKDCSGRDPLDLGSQVLFELGRCPRCGITKAKLHEHGGVVYYNEIVGAAGRRGGKTTMLGSFMGSYTLHRVLCLEKPWEYYDLIPGQQIEMTFIAAAATQAKDTVWQAFRNALSYSPWFKRYTNAVKSIEKRTPGVHMGDLFDDESETRIDFKMSKIVCVALNSNSGSAVGRTNIMVALDELAKFDHTTSKRSADEVYESMKKGLATIRAAAELRRLKGDNDAVDAVMGSISSPMWADDKIMRLVKSAEESSRMFAFHKTTYELNPKVTRETTADDYVTNPVGAMRDYDAIAPDAFNPFIIDKSVIDNSIGKELSPILSYQESFEDRGDFSYVILRLVRCLSDKMIRRVITLDAGRKRDSFGICISHVQAQTGIVVCDAVIDVKPVPKEVGSATRSREVHFESVLQFLMELNRYIFIQFIVYDRWASISHVQALRDNRFEVLEFNVGYDQYVNFRKGLAWGKVKMLPPEKGSESIDVGRVRGFPAAKMLFELRSLQEVQGKKVEKSPNSSDDLIQCMVGCHCILTASPHELAELIRRSSSSASKYPKLGYMRTGSGRPSGKVTRFSR